MRGWSSLLVGSVLLALAAWLQWTGLSSAAAITCGLAGAFLIYRGFQGLEVTEAGDPTALGDFISDPAGALVEAAAEKVEVRLRESRKTRAGDSSDELSTGFDADAALARYMANRPAAAAAAGETAPAARGFGRKGI
jgi:hypothetical protein